VDFSGLSLNELLSGIGTPAPKARVKPMNVLPPQAIANDILTLRYGDPELDRKVASCAKVRTLQIHGLPVGVRLAQGVDQKGFYFYFDDGSHDFRRHYHPEGLKEIRVNGQFINIDTERKWLIEAFVARYNRNLGGFTNLNNTSHAGSMFSYLCSLSQMPDSKLDFLLKIINAAVAESSDPYLMLYLFDVVVCRILKSLIVRKYKARPVTVDQSEILIVIENAIKLLGTVITDCRAELAKVGISAHSEQFMPMASASLRMNPVAFWCGAYYQAERRQLLMLESLSRFRDDTVLQLLSESEMLALVSDGAAKDRHQPPETSADMVEFHIQKVMKPEVRAVNWTIFK
jgi:hypothetical protein